MSALYQLYAAALYQEDMEVENNTPPTSPPTSPVLEMVSVEEVVEEEPLQQHHLSVEDQKNLMRFLRLLEVSKRDVARFTRRCKHARQTFGEKSHEMLLCNEQLAYAKRNYERILSQFETFRCAHY